MINYSLQEANIYMFEIYIANNTFLLFLCLKFFLYIILVYEVFIIILYNFFYYNII